VREVVRVLTPTAVASGSTRLAASPTAHPPICEKGDVMNSTRLTITSMTSSERFGSLCAVSRLEGARASTTVTLRRSGGPWRETEGDRVGQGTPSASGRAPEPSGVVPEGGIRALLCIRGSTGSVGQQRGDAAHLRPRHRARHRRDSPLRRPFTLGSRGLRGRVNRCDRAGEAHRPSDERRRRNGGNGGA
jgi:hypothetical protein